MDCSPHRRTGLETGGGPLPSTESVADRAGLTMYSQASILIILSELQLSQTSLVQSFHNVIGLILND